MIDELELAKQLRLRFPDGVEKNGPAITMTRRFVEEVVAMIATAFENASLEILLALQHDDTETDIRAFVTYVEPITNTVTMVISPYLVRIDNDQLWVAQKNAAPELFWLLLPHIEKTIETARAAA